MGSVRIGSWFADASNVVDGFTIEDIDGWDDSPDYRTTDIERPQAHGSFELPAFSGSRRISISGFCFADSDPELGHKKNQLSGLMSDGLFHRMVIKDQGITSWADVQRVGSKFKTIAAGDVARYQLQVWAADPRKFGDTRAFAAGVASYHYGNFAAAPVHTVTGVGSGYTINGPGGRTFTVTKAVTSGHPHTIDMATGFLSVDGVVVVGSVTSADVWSVPPGGTVTHTLTGSGVTLSTAVKDTYI
jgi:hypothetical protein